MPRRFYARSTAGPARSLMKSRILSGVIGLSFLSLMALGAIGWVGSERALRPAYPRYEWTLATYPDLHPEPIRIGTQNKVFLDGRFFPGDRRSLVILASGYGDTQDQMLPFAEFLHQAGFNVLTYNSRARAPSGGEYVTLGVLEQRDLLSVVGYAAASRCRSKPNRRSGYLDGRLGCPSQHGTRSTHQGSCG